MNPMDRIERQFAQVFPDNRVNPSAHCSVCGTLKRDVIGCTNTPCDLKKDRLRELQSDLHIKGEQV